MSESERHIVVRGGASGFAVEITVGDHLLHADEPRDVPGGTNTGPDPYELLLAALGACKTMTMRMYADKKKWPLEGSTVRLRHQKIYATDCADCETKEGKIDDIAVAIELRGPLDDAQRARLLDISTRCPVHRTLESEVRIRFE